MSDPQGFGAGTGPGQLGSVPRGLLLTALAVAVGIAVLASISRIGPTTTAALTRPTTTTTVPPTTTTTLATHPPASVKVLVANGTSVKGAAGRLATKLSSGGYDTLAPTDTLSPVKASAVYYVAGYEGDAQAIAAAAGLSATDVQPMSSSVPVAVGSAEVVVIVGPDLASTV